MIDRCVLSSCVGVALLVALLGGARAQPAAAPDTYPSRAIRIVVPSSAGSGSDVMCRAIASQLQTSLRQTVFIENVPGAAGLIGAERVKNAAPDGYTLVFANLSSIVMAPLGTTPPAYDPVKDFVPVAAAYQVLLTAVSNASVPAKNLKEFVEYVQKHPGKVNYASAGVMSFAHVWTELLKKQHGLNMVHVPYKGAGPAFLATLGGEAQFNVSEMNTMGGFATSPDIRVLAQLGGRRADVLRDVETVAEAGLPDLTSSFWFGLLAPRGTPPAIVKRLNDEINRAMETPELRKIVTATGGEAIRADSATFAKMVAGNTSQWVPIIRDLASSAK